MTDRTSWKGPTVTEIARAAGVGTATVDRVLNRRSGVREATRRKVMEAIEQLQSAGEGSAVRSIAFIIAAGPSFIQLLERTVKAFIASHKGVDCSFDSVTTAEANPAEFARLIEQRAQENDGIVLVAPEDPLINRAVKAAVDRGVPVICLTTDLPNSGRSAYVGVDQTCSGATAAFYMGRMLPKTEGRILIVISTPYRVLEEREIGFRRVLRADFPHLQLEERVNSKDDSAYSYDSVKRYLDEHPDVVGIYNAAGGNRGIAQAIEASGRHGEVLFIGHEITEHTRTLLDSGQMDIVLGHDLEYEVAASVELIDTALQDGEVSDLKVPLLTYNRYSSL